MLWPGECCRHHTFDVCTRPALAHRLPQPMPIALRCGCMALRARRESLQVAGSGGARTHHCATSAFERGGFCMHRGRSRRALSSCHTWSGCGWQQRAAQEQPLGGTGSRTVRGCVRASSLERRLDFRHNCSNATYRRKFDPLTNGAPSGQRGSSATHGSPSVGVRAVAACGIGWLTTPHRVWGPR